MQYYLYYLEPSYLTLLILLRFQIIEFYNNTGGRHRKYTVFSFSSLWENSFISSSLCKTNLPATTTILNSKRCKKPTLFKGEKCGNRLPISDSLFHCSVQDNQVKNTPQNYINEMIFLILNPLAVFLERLADSTFK